MEHYKISIKQLNCNKLCDKKWFKVNHLSSGQYSVNKYSVNKNPQS